MIPNFLKTYIPSFPKYKTQIAIQWSLIVFEIFPRYWDIYLELMDTSNEPESSKYQAKLKELKEWHRTICSEIASLLIAVYGGLLDYLHKSKEDRLVRDFVELVYSEEPKEGWDKEKIDAWEKMNLRKVLEAKIAPKDIPSLLQDINVALTKSGLLRLTALGKRFK